MPAFDSSFSVPDKEYFSFQEIVTLTGVRSYVLRYWEAEFPQIGSVLIGGQKSYSRESVELFLKIRDLLFEEKLSMTKVKAILNTSSSDSSSLITHDPGIKNSLGHELQPQPLQNNFDQVIFDQIKVRIKQQINLLQEWRADIR